MQRTYIISIMSSCWPRGNSSPTHHFHAHRLYLSSKPQARGKHRQPSQGSVMWRLRRYINAFLLFLETHGEGETSCVPLGDATCLARAATEASLVAVGQFSFSVSGIPSANFQRFWRGVRCYGGICHRGIRSCRVDPAKTVPGLECSRCCRYHRFQ